MRIALFSTWSAEVFCQRLIDFDMQTHSTLQYNAIIQRKYGRLMISSGMAIVSMDHMCPVRIWKSTQSSILRPNLALFSQFERFLCVLLHSKIVLSLKHNFCSQPKNADFYIFVISNEQSSFPEEPVKLIQWVKIAHSLLLRWGSPAKHSSRNEGILFRLWRKEIPKIPDIFTLFH